MNSQITKPATKSGLTEKQTNFLIAQVEEQLLAATLEMEKKKNPLQEAYDLYKMASDDYNLSKAKFDELSELKNTLVDFKQGPTTQMRRVLTTTSATEKKGKKFTHSGIKWLEIAMDILKKNDMFLPKENLFHMVCSFDEATIKAVKATGKPENILRSTTFHNWDRACKVSADKKKGKIVEYKGKIGLFEWVNDNLTPKPKYLKGFMY